MGTLAKEHIIFSIFAFMKTKRSVISTVDLMVLSMFCDKCAFHNSVTFVMISYSYMYILHMPVYNIYLTSCYEAAIVIILSVVKRTPSLLQTDSTKTKSEFVCVHGTRYLFTDVVFTYLLYNYNSLTLKSKINGSIIFNALFY